jgi:hypothetical protein
MGDVLEVGVVLRDELLAKRQRDKNARREISVFVDSEIVAPGERVRIESLEKVGFGVLSVFPIDDCSGQVGVESVSEESRGAGWCKT